jgi:hypothetical protein
MERQMTEIDINALRRAVGPGEVFALGPFRYQPESEVHGLGVHVLGRWGYTVGMVEARFPDRAAAQAQADAINAALGLSSYAVEAIVADTRHRFDAKLDEDDGVIALKLTRSQIENIEGNLHVAPCVDPAAMRVFQSALAGSSPANGEPLALTKDNLVHSIVSIIGQTRFDVLGGEEGLVGANERACLTAFMGGQKGPEVDLVRRAFAQVSKKGLYPFFEAVAPSP